VSIANYVSWHANNTFLIISPLGWPVYDSNPQRPTLIHKKPCHVYGLCQTLRHCCCYFFVCRLFHFSFFFLFFVISLFNFPTFTFSYYTSACVSLSQFEICGRKWIGYVIILYLQPPTWSHFPCVFLFFN